MAKRVVAEDGKPSEELQQLVADADTGGAPPAASRASSSSRSRSPGRCSSSGTRRRCPSSSASAILNDTEARSLHLGIGLLLAFLCFPLVKSQRQSIPWFDWILALAAAFAGAYFLLFYASSRRGPGRPILQDIIVATVGIVLLLEATRRAVGLPMTILAIIFLAYIMLGRYLPDVIAHKGASLERMLSHQWLTTEGVFGVALGVSVGYIFIFVLFGALLDRAGAGNYMMQVSFALLGHLRGGPAKVAVVSSGLNGLISGSSVSNVVSGGIFTIPLMKQGGLRRREGGRDRDRVLGQRPDHAAGDGRGRVPDGRVRRHPVHRDRQARVPAGDDLVHRALLHRAPRGAEARHAADGAGAQAHAAAEAASPGASASRARSSCAR